mmetsp:Transcript_38919/g.121153  ORF Transcript_38919/g.121153 Transcript_38919/m.121153 type:complete len:375 (-) Transcript_38919:9-1133(-)
MLADPRRGLDDDLAAGPRTIPRQLRGAVKHDRRLLRGCLRRVECRPGDVQRGHVGTEVPGELVEPVQLDAQRTAVETSSAALCLVDLRLVHVGQVVQLGGDVHELLHLVDTGDGPVRHPALSRLRLCGRAEEGQRAPPGVRCLLVSGAQLLVAAGQHPAQRGVWQGAAAEERRLPREDVPDLSVLLLDVHCPLAGVLRVQQRNPARRVVDAGPDPPVLPAVHHLDHLDELALLHRRHVLAVQRRRRRDVHAPDCAVQAAEHRHGPAVAAAESCEGDPAAGLLQAPADAAVLLHLCDLQHRESRALEDLANVTAAHGAPGCDVNVVKHAVEAGCQAQRSPRLLVAEKGSERRVCHRRGRADRDAHQDGTEIEAAS